jgi:cysteine desulfurase
VSSTDLAGYFDAATAVPLHPVARQALVAALADGWADPTKRYAPARRARLLQDAARGAVAEVLAVREDEVQFTSGGTAAVRAAVLGGLAGAAEAGVGAGHSGAGHSGAGHSGAGHSGADAGVLVHSAIEHSSLLYAAARHRAAGGGAVPVPVDRLGRVDLVAWRAAVAGPRVALAALLSASHEVGTVQPVTGAAAACAGARVPLLVDAAQSLGRVPVPDGWSILTGSAHKWGGPPGVGILVVRKGTRWSPPDPLPGGEPGLPALVAAAAGLRAAAGEARAETDRLRPLVDRIRATVAATVPDVEVIGDPVDRLPHLVTFSCLYLDGEVLLQALDRLGFAVSSGSSCTSATLRPSHVLEAMGVLSHGNVRVSLHRGTTEQQVERFLAELPGLVARLRAEVGG